MSDVEFSEEEAYKAEILKKIGKSGGVTSKLTKLPITLGLAKDAAGANIILAMIGILALVSAILLFALAG